MLLFSCNMHFTANSTWPLSHLAHFSHGSHRCYTHCQAQAHIHVLHNVSASNGHFELQLGRVASGSLPRFKVSAAFSNLDLLSCCLLIMYATCCHLRLDAGSWNQTDAVVLAVVGCKLKPCCCCCCSCSFACFTPALWKNDHVWVVLSVFHGFITLIFVIVDFKLACVSPEPIISPPLSLPFKLMTQYLQ